MTPARELITHAFEAALEAVEPSAAVLRALGRDTHGTLTVNGEVIGAPAAIEIIAIGKAAMAMMAGATTALDGFNIRRGFVLTKDGHATSSSGAGKVEVHEAAHPVLDERSIAATRRLLEWTAEIDSGATVFCLISGGGSALLEAPVDGVSLPDFQEMTNLTLRAGADIHQLNAVRSKVSRVKGGGLRALIPVDQVVTLALSDVLGNDLTVIASGPTVPGRSTRQDARSVIKELRLREALPQSILAALQTDTGSLGLAYPLDRATVIADNAVAVNEAASNLRSNSLRVRVNSQPQIGEARDIAERWVRQLRDQPKSLDAVLAGGELTVTVRGQGLGGRNTEFALAAALELEALSLDEWTVASLATDGQDGTTGAAGAIVDGKIPARLRAFGIDPGAAIEANDSYPALRVVDAIVETGPTGTNVNDLFFAVRNPVS